jgi:hypothetical protein
MINNQYVMKNFDNILFVDQSIKMHIIQSISFLNKKKMKNYFNHLALSFSAFLMLMVSIVSQPLYGAGNLFENRTDVHRCVYSMSYQAVCDQLVKPIRKAEVICPDEIEIDLGFGECGALVEFEIEDTNPGPVVLDAFDPIAGIVESDINSTIYCGQGPTAYRRTFTNNGNTDFILTKALIGVFEASNNPSYTINFRRLNGELLHSEVETVASDLSRKIITPDLDDFVIPVDSSVIMEIVTNIPIVSVFKIGRTTKPNIPGYSPVTILAPNCVNVQLDMNTIPLLPGQTPDAIYFGASGEYVPYQVTNVGTGIEATLNSGDIFPAGQYYMEYEIKYANGAESVVCPFDVIINEFEGVESAVACHDLVHVSVGEGCSAEITAGMILQGDSYGCYDDYEVEVFNTSGISIGTSIGSQYLDKKLKVTVTGPDGNSCWGEVIIEDKTAPDLVCTDIYTTCSSSLAPGSLMNDRFSATAQILAPEINDNGTRLVRFDTFVMPGSIVNDLNVSIKFSHPRLSDISATITSPEGITVPLFNNITCTGNVFDGVIDDQAVAVGGPACEPLTNNAIGSFKPLTALSIFNGRPISGQWTVRFFDNLTGQVGVINNVDLIFNQTGARVPFPVDKPITWVLADPGNPTVFVVNGLDECGSMQLSYTDVVEDQPCASKYAQIIKRCWTGFDRFGNYALPCCQTIYVIRNGLSTLEWPANYDGTPGNEPALSCDDYSLNNLPTVEDTGEPTGDFCSNVQLAAPEDVIINICPKSFKILRTHKVIEWCTGTILVHVQIIKVEDVDGPEVAQARDTTINTNTNDCFATFRATRPALVYDCSGIERYELSYAVDLTAEPIEYTTAGVNQSSFQIQNLPIGTSSIKWTVRDSCKNESEMIYNVTVQDKIAPNVVCDIFTTASITGVNGGKAIVEALTFDDGSNDNCGIKSYAVRRRVAGCGQQGGDNAPFLPEVEFCCSEVGSSVMVELRVTDVNNNSNTCMVNVRIEDKLPPYITFCPADITIDCQADFKNTDITGRIKAVDNCEMPETKFNDIVEVNNCGVGKVTRTWTAIDKQGLQDNCVQIITLRDDRPFNGNDPGAIRWPSDYTTNTCASSLHPDNLADQYVLTLEDIRDDNCSLIGIHYKDTRFDIVDDACVKILREWTVIDWCTYDENYPEEGGIYTRIQILKIQDNEPPIFDGLCEDVTISSAGHCRDSVNITKTAIDSCRDEFFQLEWKYEIFYPGELESFKEGNTNRIRTILEDGEYRVRWTVEDKCGNVAVCNHKLTVADRKKPTPVCHGEIVTAVMQTNGTVEIWANDFDKGSYDNCTTQKRLNFTFYDAQPVAALMNNSDHFFKGNGILTLEAEYRAGRAQKWDYKKRTSGMIFTCDSLIGGIAYDLPIKMTVTDSVGNFDHCTAILSLQDNNNICPDTDPMFATVSGRIQTATQQGLANTEVRLLNGREDVAKMMTTTNTGLFSFNTVLPNQSYTLEASNNRNHLNGVSTLDLVLIQRHILGLAPFTEPRKIIASDVDNNERITASDLLNLRKNILGINNEFPNGQQSYRFVVKTHQFADPASPFPFVEQYVYNRIAGQKLNQDFISVKIGDVNDSATYGAEGEDLTPRTTKNIFLSTEDVNMRAGQEYLMPIYADQTNLLGLQGTLSFDPTKVAILGTQNGIFDVSDANFGFQALQEGKVTFSINNTELTKSPSKVLFYIKIKALQEGNPTQVFGLSSDMTPNGAYDVEYRTVGLVWKQQEVANIELGQNNPNPFTHTTMISFSLPTSTEATLKIIDLNGRVVREWTSTYPAGSNEISISRDDLPQAGVYMYQLSSEGRSVTKKMIVIGDK